ncbi:MAG: hypothetical protein ACREHC_08645, partial [Candidatus Levyibacteriota bacterium]
GTIYRLIAPLMNMGLITKTDKYPYVFTAKPKTEGLSLFLLHQNDWFSQQFSQQDKENHSQKNGDIPQSKQIELSFIQSRDELMNLSAHEINKANQSVDLLRSGHEMPADVMLALLEAKKRNVLTRMLVQDYSSENAETIGYWQKNGILVRKTSLRHIRLMLYDDKNVYFMSYKNIDSEKDLGMEINYPPFATILSDLFNEWWEKAERI